MGTLQTEERGAEIGVVSEENEALARSVYDNFDARELEKTTAFISDDCEWLDVSSGVIFKGPSGYLEFDGAWLSAFPDGKLEVTNVICHGDLVATEFTGRGTHEGPLTNPSGDTIPATGKKVEVRCVEVLQFRDRKIVRARFYYDGISMLKQLGVMK